MAYELMFLIMMLYKNTPYVVYNWWLKRLTTQINKPTNQLSIKVPKVDKPTNIKTLISNFEAHPMSPPFLYNNSTRNWHFNFCRRWIVQHRVMWQGWRVQRGHVQAPLLLRWDGTQGWRRHLWRGKINQVVEMKHFSELLVLSFKVLIDH